MQYVRLYINDFGVIEHTETSTAPLKDTPHVIVHEPAPTPDNAFATKVRAFDEVRLEFEPGNQRFMRAQELTDQVEIDRETLRPALKSGRQGTVSKIEVKRANRGGE